MTIPETATKFTTGAAYTVSLSLTASDMLHFLNANAAAIGVILGILTFIVNLVFQILNRRSIKEKSLFNFDE